MSKSIHKGTELNNVKETWEQNEKEEPKSADLVLAMKASTVKLRKKQKNMKMLINRIDY